MLFSGANERECGEMVRTLHEYEGASGQKVNFAKSEVSFSRRVTEVKACFLASLFGMR